MDDIRVVALCDPIVALHARATPSFAFPDVAQPDLQVPDFRPGVARPGEPASGP